VWQLEQFAVYGTCMAKHGQHGHAVDVVGHVGAPLAA
jgi:hypothetical protein